MKAFNLSHWDAFNARKGLLFFAQTLEEMLFHYGHDSLKVPALNFHFLCFEIHSTIYNIQNEIVDKGNMRPLYEELKEMFSRDIIAQKIFGNEFDCIFYLKNEQGELCRCNGELKKDPCSEKSIKQIGDAAKYFLVEMEKDNRYYNLIKQTITEKIKAQPFSPADMEELYHLCKILLTELINSAYSQEYIYWVASDLFFNQRKRIADVDEVLELFWSSFDFAEKEYFVTLPLKRSNLSKHLRYFKNVEVKNNNENLFGNSCGKIITVSVNAMDQYTAQSDAIALVSFFVSLLQFNNHKSQSYSADQAIVLLKGSEKPIFLQTPITPLKRGKNLSDEMNNEKMDKMVTNFHFSPSTLVNVIALHSAAINSSDIGNQLLNLWTIIEVLIPAEKTGSYSKIVQICNVLTSILNSNHVSSLIEQLLSDLGHCIPDTIATQMESIDELSNDNEKMVAILSLPKYSVEKNDIIQSLENYPLLQYRINDYSNVLSSRINLKKFLDEHRKRLSWHIMRIYRNRNMIVHDGTHFPYIDVIVQNLHYYADTLIDTINQYFGEGYSSIRILYSVLQQKERKLLLSVLEAKESDGSIKQVDAEYVKAILGNLV